MPRLIAKYRESGVGFVSDERDVHVGGSRTSCALGEGAVRSEKRREDERCEPGFELHRALSGT